MEKKEKPTTMAGHNVETSAAERQQLVSLYNSLNIPKPTKGPMKA